MTAFAFTERTARQIIRNLWHSKVDNSTVALSQRKRRIVHGAGLQVYLGKVSTSEIQSGDTDGVVDIWAAADATSAPTSTGEQLTDVAFDWMTNGVDLPAGTEVLVATVGPRKQIIMWECP